jgi:hypothetical protein
MIAGRAIWRCRPMSAGVAAGCSRMRAIDPATAPAQLQAYAVGSIGRTNLLFQVRLICAGLHFALDRCADIQNSYMRTADVRGANLILSAQKNPIVKHRVRIALAGLALIVGPMVVLIYVLSSRVNSDIGAYVLFEGENCTIRSLRIGPLLGPGTEARTRDNGLFWVESNCPAYRIASSRRLDVATVNGAYRIAETPKGDNRFNPWRYAVESKEPSDSRRVPLIIEVIDLWESASFSRLTLDLGVRPTNLKISAYGSGTTLLSNMMVNEGAESKDVVIAYVDLDRERLEQIAIIVLSTLIGVGASLVFGGWAAARG